MKRILPIILMAILAAQIFLFCACVPTHDTQPDEQPDTPNPVTFQVTYTAGEGGHIEGQAEQTVEQGKDATSVTAVADKGYEFEKWSDGVTNYEREIDFYYNRTFIEWFDGTYTLTLTPIFEKIEE